MNRFNKRIQIIFILIMAIVFNGIAQSDTLEPNPGILDTITPAADLPKTYLPFLYDKEIAVITNQTGRIKGHHLVDFLLYENINVAKIFAPEHGFRGDASDGTEVQNGRDILTGLQVLSIYGKKKKPSEQDLQDIEVLVFDIQDVGVRFYTYISSLTYVMEAAAENDIPIIVLDRPNPNAHYIDGPVLDTAFSSFVGMHPVPVVYGMTIGEYARMVKGEGWINKSDKLDLTVVPMENYTHDSIYTLPVAPSPNLPDNKSIYLYPWICYFEGANVSVGRGTGAPFRLIGFPGFVGGDTTFTPHPIPGKSESPPFLNEQCNGINLKKIPLEELENATKIDWTYVWDMYKALGEEKFFLENNYFDLLAGSKLLRTALIQGWSIERFKSEYQPDVDAFKKIRKKYVMYE